MVGRVDIKKREKCSVQKSSIFQFRLLSQNLNSLATPDLSRGLDGWLCRISWQCMKGKIERSSEISVADTYLTHVIAVPLQSSLRRETDELILELKNQWFSSLLELVKTQNPCFSRNTRFQCFLSSQIKAKAWNFQICAQKSLKNYIF